MYFKGLLGRFKDIVGHLRTFSGFKGDLRGFEKVKIVCRRFKDA